VDSLDDDAIERTGRFVDKFLEELPKLTVRIKKLQDGTLKFTKKDGTYWFEKPEKESE
jgi:hypothetical protein